MPNLKIEKTKYPIRVANLQNYQYKIFNCKNFVTIQLNSDSYKIFNYIFKNDISDIDTLYKVSTEENLNISKQDTYNFLEFLKNNEFIECEYYENK